MYILFIVLPLSIQELSRKDCNIQYHHSRKARDF